MSVSCTSRPSGYPGFRAPTAAQVLQSVVNLPTVAAGIDREFFYTNTAQATGGYLPLLATGTRPADLETAYAVALQERVLGPAGMTGRGSSTTRAGSSTTTSPVSVRKSGRDRSSPRRST